MTDDVRDFLKELQGKSAYEIYVFGRKDGFSAVFWLIPLAWSIGIFMGAWKP